LIPVVLLALTTSLGAQPDQQRPATLGRKADLPFDLPLLQADLRTLLADEPLSLHRYDETLGLAVGSVALVATDPGALPRAARIDGARGPIVLLGSTGQIEHHAVRATEPAALPALLRRLRALPGVRAAWPDLLKIELGAPPAGFVRPDYDPAGFSLVDALGVEPLWQRGAGVRVAIIDSVVDPNLAGLTARPIAIRDPWPAIRALPAASPGPGHGTRVASVIAAVDDERRLRGVAPGVALISIPLRSTWTSELIAALHQAAAAGADIVVCPWDDSLLLEPVSALLDHLSTAGRDGRGMLIVAAAGNRYYDSSAMPSFANHPATLSVTALDHRATVVGAWGRGVDLAAPSMLPVLPRRADGQPSFLGKTSAATPVVAGVAALLLSVFPELHADQLRSILRASATPLAHAPEAEGREFGFGALAPVMAFDLAQARKEAP
jgi:subtilisin family serine protease